MRFLFYQHFAFLTLNGIDNSIIFWLQHFNKWDTDLAPPLSVISWWNMTLALDVWRWTTLLLPAFKSRDWPTPSGPETGRCAAKLPWLTKTLLASLWEPITNEQIWIFCLNLREPKKFSNIFHPIFSLSFSLTLLAASFIICSLSISHSSLGTWVTLNFPWRPRPCKANFWAPSMDSEEMMWTAFSDSYWSDSSKLLLANVAWYAEALRKEKK